MTFLSQHLKMNPTPEPYGPSHLPTVYSDAGKRPVNGAATVEMMTLVCGVFYYAVASKVAESSCEAELWAMERAIGLAKRQGLRSFRLINDNETAVLLMRREKKPRKPLIIQAVRRCFEAASGLRIQYVAVIRDDNLAGVKLEKLQDSLR